MIGEFLNKKATQNYDKYYWLYNKQGKEDESKIYYKKYKRWSKLEDKWTDFIDGFKFILIIATFIIVILGGILGLFAVSCSNFTTNTGLQTKYDVLSGCYVRYNDMWVLKEQLRYFGDK